MIRKLSELPLDDGTQAAILKAGIGLERLTEHAVRGTLQTIPGIGAGRAAAIDAALVAAGQIEPDHPSPGRTPPAAAAAPGQDEGDPTSPLPDPAPVRPPAVAQAPDSGFTSYADQVASWARVRLRVDGLAEGAAAQAWFVQAGLPGTVVDALELIVKPAGDATARAVYVMADDEGVQKFTVAGGSGRFGHRELSGKVVVE